MKSEDERKTLLIQYVLYSPPLPPQTSHFLCVRVRACACVCVNVCVCVCVCACVRA